MYSRGSDFNPRAPHGGATRLSAVCRPSATISIHAPRMGARHGREMVFLTSDSISIHAPRMGARLKHRLNRSKCHLFQSTRPAWGRDVGTERIGAAAAHFNPRAPHGGATWRMRVSRPRRQISIHAPRMGARLDRDGARGRATHFNPRAPHGGATFLCPPTTVHVGISIHAPRMGARPLLPIACDIILLFQSTRPAWGRDGWLPAHRHAAHHFNPRAPHGGATTSRCCEAATGEISIHAPRMGARPAARVLREIARLFQSTRPAWGRDDACRWKTPPCADFNPRAPHGGATSAARREKENGKISIHAPRMGARPPFPSWEFVNKRFQSTRPAWGRDTCYATVDTLFMISIHAPRMGARPIDDFPLQSCYVISIHAPRMGARPRVRTQSRGCRDFNPRAPHGGATSLFLP